MTISGNYSSPVQVNGFSCRNCTDVDYAKKHIDPAHPRSGPYDVNAQTDPSRTFSDVLKPGGANQAPAARPDATGYSVTGEDRSSDYISGRQLDIVA